MKKMIALLLLATCCFNFIHAQNVGIGTDVPAYNLHVYNADASTIAVQSNNASTSSELRLQGTGGFSLIKRFGQTEGGTLAGISVADITSMYASSGGGLLIGSNSSIRLATNDIVQMEIGSSGNIGIGAGLSPFYKLNISTSAYSGIFATSTYSPAGSVVISSIHGRIPISTEGVRAGVIGSTLNGGSSAGYFIGNYGVIGSAITNGYGVAAFATGGANGIFSNVSGSGKALVTVGPVQLQNIGALAGRVLVCDDAGNATWQNVPSGNHNHFGEAWSGSVALANTSGISVTNSSTEIRTSAIQGVQSAATGNLSAGVRGDAASNQGIGVFGFSYTGGFYSDPVPASGVSGVASTGTGVAGKSYTGTGMYGYSVDGKAAQFEMTVASNTNPAVLITANSKTALELNNGFIKVSGANKTAFVHTAIAGNTSGNATRLSYLNPSSSDIVIVTPNWNPGGTGGTYLDKAIGVYWNTQTWAIFTQDGSAMPTGAAFNVLVIKQ